MTLKEDKLHLQVISKNKPVGSANFSLKPLSRYGVYALLLLVIIRIAILWCNFIRWYLTDNKRGNVTNCVVFFRARQEREKKNLFATNFLGH